MNIESDESTEYKDARVELRLAWSMKEEMEREAARLGTTVSVLIRALFQDYVRRRAAHRNRR